MEEEKKPSAAAWLHWGVVGERRLTVNARLVPSQLDANDRIRSLRTLSLRHDDCETKGATGPIQEYFDAIARESASLAKTKYELAIAELIAARARNALEKVAANEEPEKVFMLATARLEPADLDSRASYDRTALMGWAEAGDAEQVARLLKLGANPNRTRSYVPDSALTIAMEKYGWVNVDRKPGAEKYLSVIRTLLAHPGMNPDLRDDPDGSTPLMWALERGQDDVVELLLAAGANPNLTARGRQESALHIATLRAASGNNAAGVPMPGASRQYQLLLAAKNLDLNMANTYDHNTALTDALSKANPLIARQLLDAGADPNATNRGQQPPLIVATQAAILNPEYRKEKYVETVKLIADWPGVRKDVPYLGKTAMQMAKEAKREDLIRVLQGN
jgi:ankyrin repeat protein